MFSLPLRRLRGIALTTAVLGLVTVARAEAQVSLAVAEASVVVQNGQADATFRLEVTNQGSSVAGNVWVVMPDGTSTWFGDVAGDGGSAKGASETHRFDVSSVPPTRHVPIAVTLKFSVDGADVEHPAWITLTAQE